MAVDLLTNVIIGGQTTSGFDALAGRLESLGATVDKIGRYMREFEEESVQVYRSYEDNMLAAEYALSAKYSSATELSKVMQSLDEHASQWAASTIFHTDDVGKAINEAAHAGWNYQEIVKGIPQAMYIAQAGSMDLSDGLDYLVKMMGATGTEFDDIGKAIDQWSKASNLSATNINEMGEAFMSMGSAAQFGDSTAELFTMLAILADVGTTGSTAGTALRSAMMRIIAPTTKAENAMSLLRADADELNQVLADENVTKAAKTLQGLGFSAYDSEGKLLPMIDIFTNLHGALQGLKEQSQNEILAAIFPTRNIAAANAFIESVGNGKMAGLFKEISDSEGYAAKGSELMMSGLTGAIETLASKWEEFERSVGETLAPAIEKVAGWLSSIMDSINSMDEATLNGLVGSMTALAGLGPVMLGAGGIVKAVTTLGLKGTLLVGAVMAAGALYGYFSKLNEINFEENFGKMELDLDTLGEHVNSLKTTFDTQQESIATWEAALEAAETKYADKSSKLAETMLTDVLTGKKLTPEEIQNINAYANDLYKAVWEGIENAKASDMSFLVAIFGDHENAQQEEVGNTAAKVVSGWYDSIYGEAQAVGEELRNKMTEALQDGSLNEAERQAIQSSVDRYNQIMAEIQSQMDAEAYYEQLYKAQSVSWDTISDYINENTAKQEADLAALDDAYAAKWAHYRAAFDYAIQNGTELTDLNGQTRKVTEGDWASFEKEFELEKAKARQSVIDKYGSLSAAALDSLMNDSDFSTGWNYLKWMQKNGVEAQTQDQYGNWDDNWASMQLTPELAKILSEQLIGLDSADSSWFGLGKGKLTNLLKPYADNPIIAGYIDMLDNAFGVGAAATSYENMRYNYEETDRDPYNLFSTPESRATYERLTAKQAELDGLLQRQTQIDTEIATRQARMDANNYNLWDVAFGTDYHDDWTAIHKNGGLEDQQTQIALDITQAEADVAALQAELDGLQVSDPLWVKTEIDSTAVDSYTPPSKHMKIIPFVIGQAYAEGGRATTPSIFGEAGAEWAIPEEHTARTAELLNAAREASGFTWDDLISRYGGLNANPQNPNVILHYSPTINAQNAEGVSDVLKADKARLLKMVKDALSHERLRDDVEVYA